MSGVLFIAELSPTGVYGLQIVSVTSLVIVGYGIRIPLVVVCMYRNIPIRDTSFFDG